MKFLKFFLISALLLCVADGAWPCGIYHYTPGGYYMYRVYEADPEPELGVKEAYSGAAVNCEAWRRLTSKDIPLEDIYSVVYKMTLKEFEAVYNNRAEGYENKFLEWITKRDAAVVDFLLLAKCNEHIRLKLNSRWYYPTMEIDAPMRLDEIPAKALSADDKRLRDRYLLQAVRALFSLGKYDECIALWESEASLLPRDNLMRRLIQPYVAGAEYRVNNSDKAVAYFAQLGDVNSMLFCAGRAGEELSTLEALELVCEYAPNSDYIPRTLQKYVRGLEPTGEVYQYLDRPVAVDEKFLALCLRMARDKRVENTAMWYYTAAFLADLEGDVHEASRLLSLAERGCTSKYIGQSIKVFRIYLDAQMATYDADYEHKLWAQLRWLDAMIVAGIDDNVRNETARGYKLQTLISYYYWNDVMRRIVLSEVCPRMIKAGKTTRALQLANMADNRLLGIVNKREKTQWQKVDGKYKDVVTEAYTLEAYRYSDDFNPYDYSNSFFEMIDSLGLDAAVKYVQSVQYPQSDFDSYLNKRGYTNCDYLYDILGTQSLRNMCYARAVDYLGRVSPGYKKHHNLYLNYDPFSVEYERIEASDDFKYDFAREMLSLEQAMNGCAEPNRKARLMIKYATGIKNSFDICWTLTQYYRGSSYWGQVCGKRNWEDGKFVRAAIRRVEQLVAEAGRIVTDDEVAADIQYEFRNFRTVAEKYPYTEKGRLVRGQCDNLYDHRAMERRSRCCGWYN